MLYSLGQGRKAEPLGAARADIVEAEGRLALSMDAAHVALRGMEAPGASFGYFFRYAPDAAAEPDMAERLDALAAAMTEDEPSAARRDSTIPPAWTYFAQFLEHDVTAAVDAAAPSRRGLQPRRRDEVELSLINLRDGALKLDSLYGVDAGPGSLADKLRRLMREPDAPARMRLDRAGEPAPGRTPLPRDRGADVLRLGRLLSRDPERGVSPDELSSLPRDLRRSFMRGGEIDVARPVTGDRRNDSNVALSQLHAAMLRFHNRVVDWVADTAAASPERLFETAARLVRWHVQWIVLNEYLPLLCDPKVLARVRRAGAPIYAEFCSYVRAPGSARLPVPLEFWAAAGRFRVSMIRGSYDHNRWHGRAAGGSAPLQPRAGLEFLHASADGSSARPLSADLVMEWDRYIAGGERLSDRSARLIDTNVSPGQAHEGAFRRLARLTLRRGHWLNLPSAQDCVEEINGVYDGLIRPLGPEALASGHTGEALRRGGLVERTPLWFYILKEAEVQEGGERLGQLGSALVAETLVGLIANDPASVLHRAGLGGGPWTPAEGAQPDGRPVDGLAELLRAAEVL